MSAYLNYNVIDDPVLLGYHVLRSLPCFFFTDGILDLPLSLRVESFGKIDSRIWTGCSVICSSIVKHVDACLFKLRFQGYIMNLIGFFVEVDV